MKLHALSALEPGAAAVIFRVDSDGPLAQRLLDLGFAEGAAIRCLFRSPCGDPTAYRIRGCTVALRRMDADRILVTALEETE